MDDFVSQDDMAAAVAAATVMGRPRDSVVRQFSHTNLPGKALDEGGLRMYGRNFIRRRSKSDDALMPLNSNGSSMDSAEIKPPRRLSSNNRTTRLKADRIYDDPAITESYRNVPLLEMEKLPRGGISIETSAGRIQFGIPPETIKDSMRLGLDVPSVYIVPVDRFCREMGPALGINLAEFEFPAYFNFFVKGKKCTLIVDSEEAEKNIRTVFEETLLGPREFRDPATQKPFDEEDFDPSFPKEQRPNFFEEFRHFRVMDKSPTLKELAVETLLEFCHFDRTESDGPRNESIGVPPTSESSDEEDEQDVVAMHRSSTEFDRSAHSAGGAPRSRDADSLPMTSLSRSATDVVSNLIHKVQARSHHELSLPKSKTLERVPSVESCQSIFESAASVSGTLSTAGGDGEPGNWIFSQVKWLGEVATVWPASATAEQIEARSVPRVEIFKMPGGTEYILHDVDEHNHIIGKTRLSGTVDVPDEIAVEGFLTTDVESSVARVRAEDKEQSAAPLGGPKGFYPPSFGITILGNSHGFDKNGSTSGYVIWINGRGVMVDPPPYSSATLEREGIHPQLIIAIIITHCHADHDAGTFQKVLTGSRVAIITAPSIYTSFIRKYSALSGLSPRLLRHSHRFRPAIVGKPLRFQGATFHFNFTLHTIPCLAVRVEWRGRSVVLTGDHLNMPSLLQELQSSGVISSGRAESLGQLPLQQCDVLLHEAGAPPIHTPLSVLQALPENVKARMYVVHTSALPADCGLRVAPVGTAGTIRLDQSKVALGGGETRLARLGQEDYQGVSGTVARSSHASAEVTASLDDGGNKNLTVHGSFIVPAAADLRSHGFEVDSVPPLVFQRPTCVSDAWFILNLLSNVPFLSTLSYVHTMEVLELAKVDVYCAGEVVLPATLRKDVLCVVWEGTCMASATVDETAATNGSKWITTTSPVWHAGDWMGPVALQPNQSLADGASSSGECCDVVAVSQEGVKTISLQMNDLEKILRRGSKLYRKYLTVLRRHIADEAAGKIRAKAEGTSPLGSTVFSHEHIVDVMSCNSVLRKLPALQMRSLESVAEGPRVFEEGATLWRMGERCDYAFLIVAGTTSFDSSPLLKTRFVRARGSICSIVDLGRGRFLEADKLLQSVPPDSEYARLELILQRRAEQGFHDLAHRESIVVRTEPDKLSDDRFANKMLARLYSSHKYTSGLTFGRGCFLCDASRMVSGELLHETGDATQNMGMHLHSSTVVVGRGGCVAMVFPRSTLVPFLDSNPGMLLCLLGTQVVV